MALTSSGEIKRAIVAHLRSSVPLKTALVGGIHEGFAPNKASYPILTYQLVYAPIVRTWGSQGYYAGIDIRVFGEQSVEANNIDALVLNLLDDAPLSVTGQSTLLCHRVADFGSPDVDDEGRKIYMVGSTYEVWTSQPDVGMPAQGVVASLIDNTPVVHSPTIS
jgi:hypothetical protein